MNENQKARKTIEILYLIGSIFSFVTIGSFLIAIIFWLFGGFTLFLPFIGESEASGGTEGEFIMLVYVVIFGGYFLVASLVPIIINIVQAIFALVGRKSKRQGIHITNLVISILTIQNISSILILIASILALVHQDSHAPKVVKNEIEGEDLK